MFSMWICETLKMFIQTCVCCLMSIFFQKVCRLLLQAHVLHIQSEKKKKAFGYIITVLIPKPITSSSFIIFLVRCADDDGAPWSRRQWRPLICTPKRWRDVGLRFQLEWLCRWRRCGTPTEMKGVYFGFVWILHGGFCHREPLVWNIAAWNHF